MLDSDRRCSPAAGRQSMERGFEPGVGAGIIDDANLEPGTSL